MSTLRLLLLIILSIFFLPALYGQIQNTWIGGFPGRESDWNCHKNWSKYKVPNEFNDVVIPDTRSTTFVYPVIKKGNIVINSLEMHPGTILHIHNSVNLTILAENDTIFSAAKYYQKGGLIKHVDSNSDHTNQKRDSQNFVLKRNICNAPTKDLKH